MNIIVCYAKGLWEATLRPKMVMILWLVNFLFAALTYFLFSAAFGSVLGSSLLIRDLIKKMDMNVFIEFLTSSGVVLGEIMTAGVVLAFLYALASIFLNGGILHVLFYRSAGESLAKAFFAGSGAFFGRFFRLAIYSILLWLPALAGFLIVDGLLGVLTKNPVHEQLGFYLTLVRIAIALFLAYLVKMILDYARIGIVAKDTRKVFRELLGSVKFVLSRPMKTLILYYGLGLTGWAVFLVYRAMAGSFAQESWGGIFLGFFLAQLFIASRGWLKIAYFAAQARCSGLSEIRRAPCPAAN